MAVRVLKFDSDGFPGQIDPGADDIDVRGVIIDAGAGTGINMSGTKVTNLLAGAAAGDGVNKSQLDAAIITGGVLKELLLHQNQIDDTDGIYAAMACYFDANPTVGDIITLEDGVTTRVYEFGSLVVGDVQVTIGATPVITMQNFATAVTGDGAGSWDAVFEADALDEVDTDGVVVVYENTTSAGDSSSRMHSAAGDWGVAGVDCQVLEFAAGGTVDTEYRGTATTAIPLADPAEGRFGMRRQASALIDGEMHDNRADNYIYKWDDTTSTWMSMTGPGSIPWATSASGGGVIGISTYDSDKGLVVAAGVAAVKVDNDGIQFVGGNIARKGQDKFKLTAGAGGVTKGDPIYVSANDVGLPADGANANSKQAMGVAEDTVAAAVQFDILQEGVLLAPAVGGGAAFGDIVWLDTPSGLTVTLPVGSPRYRHKIGTMKNAADLIIDMQYMGRI